MFHATRLTPLRPSYKEQFDEWRDYDCEGNYVPFLRVEKLLLPDEALWNTGEIYV